MKLQQMSLSRLRSVRHVDVTRCGPFNVLVGKNNSGKSTLLSAIHTFFVCLGDGQIIALDPPFGEPIDFFGRDTTVPIEIDLRFSLTPKEHDDLIREIGLEAPQLRHAVDACGGPQS